MNQKDFLIGEMHPQNWLRYLLFYRSRPAPIEMTPSAKMTYFKEYNSWVTDYTPSFGLKDKVVLDVGAGCGETALLFFKEGASKVICIEPDPLKLRMLERNIQAMNWNATTVPRHFVVEDLRLDFDFVKVDIEGGENVLLALQSLPPMALEIHTKELARLFKSRFPEMHIRQLYPWPVATWLGRIHID
jgi:hypothetical protein